MTLEVQYNDAKSSCGDRFSKVIRQVTLVQSQKICREYNIWNANNLINLVLSCCLSLSVCHSGCGRLGYPITFNNCASDLQFRRNLEQHTAQPPSIHEGYNFLLPLFPNSHPQCGFYCEPLMCCCPLELVLLLLV